MARTRKTARDQGTRFESSIAAYLSEHHDDRIERRAKTGGRDRGDIAGFRFAGERIVIECKNTARTALGVWAMEAEVERRNDDANAALIIHKRHGHADPSKQWVTCTLGDLLALLSGNRDHLKDD